MAKVGFIAVHPDDESLGCGGTILKHKANSDDIIWIILTKLTEKRGISKEVIKKRIREINQVSRAYHFHKVYALDHETTQLDSASKPALINELSSIFNKHKIDSLYIPNRSDIHSDHRIAFECIMSASKTFNHPYIHKIFMYECISETEFAPALLENAFVPNYFVDISKYMDKKIKILNIYKSEIKDHPYPRSNTNFKALAAFRGAQAGVPYAEAFMILRDIWT